jgi:hypothetical protein
MSSFERPSVRPPVQSGFRFEAAWLRSPDYREVLENAWSAGKTLPGSLLSTWNTLQNVAVSLRQWSMDTFGSVHKKIKKMEHQLLFLRMGPVTDANLAEM